LLQEISKTCTLRTLPNGFASVQADPHLKPLAFVGRKRALKCDGAVTFEKNYRAQ
jgi:hypothetical protein